MLGLVLVLAGFFVMPDDPPSAETIESCAPYGDALRYAQTVQERWNPKNPGLEVSISGLCRDMTADNGDLLAHFPEHRFVAVGMSYFHQGLPGPVQLTLVQDKSSGRTTGHLWEIWFSDGGGAWASILRGYTAADDQDAMAKVKNVAQLMAGPCNCEVTSVKRAGNRIEAEVTWGGKPWRRIAVPYSQKRTFGTIREINAARQPDA